MGMRSLQSDIHSNSRRKRSFTLSSFRKAPGEQQAVITSAVAAEDAARVRKAAAWQWYTRGVAEVVLPTKMPILAGGSGLEKKPSGRESRFKAEASARKLPPGGVPLSTRRPNPAAAAPSPLYDEVELAGLKTQMANFVDRMQGKLQQSQQKAPDTLLGAPPLPAEESVAIRRSSSAASAKVSGFQRPISTLYGLFRRVVSSAFYKRNAAAATHKEPASDQAPPAKTIGAEPEVGDVQYHYHHYIHHHHHHYHYDPNTAEEAESNPRLRRHSESSGIRPRIPSLIWEENEGQKVEDDKDLKSPLCASFVRRRRHSYTSFAEVRKSASKADGGKVDVRRTPEMNELGVAGPVADQMWVPARSLSSERFKSGNKVPKEWKDYEVEVGRGDTGADVRSRRRQSAEGAASYGGSNRGRTGMEELGLRATNVDRMSGRVYKLSVPDLNYSERKAVGGRRHSEGFDRRAEEVALAHEKMLRYGLSGKDRLQGTHKSYIVGA